MARRRYTMQGGKPPTNDPDRRPPIPDEPFPPDDAPDDAPDDDEGGEPDEDDAPGRKPARSAATKREETVPDRVARLKREIADHGREWKRLNRGAGNPPPRAFQLQELMDTKQQMLEALEPMVELQVTKPTRGRSYVVGEREFLPGRHRMTASVAEVLRWMMDQDRIAEARRMHDLKEQRQMDPYGLEGILDPATQTDRSLGAVQG